MPDAACPVTGRPPMLGQILTRGEASADLARLSFTPETF
ncbi:hypothetical protein [Azospirillum palustre]